MKGKIPYFLFGFISLALVSAPVFAHHGFAGRYDEANPVTVSGTVVEYQFMNPHSMITFDVKDDKGNVQRWEAELGSAGQLHRMDGWDKDTLKPGDHVTIIGPRAKNGANDMNLSHQSRVVMTDTGKEIHNSYEKSEQ
jgi:hypothetical protein